MNELSIETVRTMARQLRSLEVRCRNHKPESTLIVSAEGSLVQVSCEECGFLAHMSEAACLDAVNRP